MVQRTLRCPLPYSRVLRHFQTRLLRRPVHQVLCLPTLRVSGFRNRVSRGSNPPCDTWAPGVGVAESKSQLVWGSDSSCPHARWLTLLVVPWLPLWHTQYDRWLTPQAESWLTPQYDRWLTPQAESWLTPQYDLWLTLQYDLWLTPFKNIIGLKMIPACLTASTSLCSSIRRRILSVMSMNNSWNGPHI